MTDINGYEKDGSLRTDGDGEAMRKAVNKIKTLGHDATSESIAGVIRQYYEYEREYIYGTNFENVSARDVKYTLKITLTPEESMLPGVDLIISSNVTRPYDLREIKDNIETYAIALTRYYKKPPVWNI